MNGNSIIREIGRSYIVSSFIPAAFFVFLFKIIFQDFFPEEIIQRVGQDNGLLDSSFAFLVLVTLWLGFSLYSAQDRIIKFYEGYHIPWPIKPVLTLISLLLLWRQEKYLREYQKWLETLPVQQKEKSLQYLYQQDLYPKLMQELQERELIAPFDKDNLLPTRLGNVLRASEDYPFHRYGLDGITIWPRLYDFLPNDLKGAIEEYNNHIAFFLNSSLLMLFMAVFSIIVAVLQYMCGSWTAITHPLCKETFWKNGFNYFSPTFYLIIGIISFFGFYLLYCFAVAAAEGYGLYVRTAFDLYRNRLLQHLNDTWSKKLEDTKESWERLAHFYIADDRLGEVEIHEKSRKGELRFFAGLLILSSLIAGILYRITGWQRGKRAAI